MTQKFVQLVQTTEPTLIKSLYQQGFLDIYERYHDEKTDPYLTTIADITTRLSLKNNYFLLVQANQTIVGLVYIEKRWHTVEIGNLLILPEFQNQGYGQATLTAIEAFFPTIQNWKLNTILQEQKLIYFYEKMGYKRVRYLKIPIKEKMDIVFYKKKRKAIKV
ncbi:GNAT family N-acetyltransferase [Periweissella beninensis]|uniref:GNAT family N-acetyltransferase n=1 Tax=Periweissella beninensis TaxID=504936 RepID=A0ABT0VKW5_9LACO|nr:GNAT family N-acetyltransferase [Periweissella beninensis]MBM7544580.1 GNAT superfamily N-acetyltransferase [Periweissella beninensis]MCM2438079.1 GNAT family N-acetyltransferase [Periweissella beninensis]MCT4396473.1 GNAT family N-acetyltransferase [Periweissella beninensis]